MSGPTKKQVHYAKQGITKAKELQETLKEIDPTFVEAFDESGMDVERAFQLFCQFTGDIERTAHALSVPPVAVLRAADRLGWAKKLEAIFELKKSGKPGDIEKSISRAMSFVQAHRLRIVLERVLSKFYAMDDAALFEAVFSIKTITKKDGTVEETRAVNTKPFSDLSAALEKCHSMCSAALADTVTERVARKERSDDSGPSATQLHTLIASVMGAGDTTSPAAQLLQQQLTDSENSQE